MRCPNCLYNNHEQAEVCERCGESLRGENKLFNTCPHCGYINEVGAEFCDSCGEALTETGLRKSVRRKNLSQQQKRKVRSRRASGSRFPWFSLLLLIFLGLVLLGLLYQPGQLAPAAVVEPETLIVLQGTEADGLSVDGANPDFAALAIDPAGVVRMELYVDGHLTGSQNYASSTQALFTPALGALTTGEHQVFVRAVNSAGQTATSQIITARSAANQGGSFELAAAQDSVPAPANLRANSIDEGQRISVSWEAPERGVESVRVYVRVPGSSGLLRLADLRSEAAQYDFIPDRDGVWEVYTAFVAENGSESELSFASLTLPSPGAAAERAGDADLPSPTHVQLATTSAQCQRTADQLSPARDAYHAACLAQVRTGQHEFLTWRWPLGWSKGEWRSDADLSGFEVKLVLVDAWGNDMGERITAVPFSEIRGALRTSQDVGCGVQRSWYVRAVGPAGKSDWAYAGAVASESCDLNAPAADGCAGQADGVALSHLPEGFLPELFFSSACESLDRCYAEGASGQPKADCDNLFRDSLLAACNENAGEVDLKVCTDLAEAYYRSANLAGAQYYAGEKSFDCLDAENSTGCFWGNLPDGILNGVDEVGGAVSWAGRAAWAGAVKFGRGVLWLVDWVVGTVSTLFP